MKNTFERKRIRAVALLAAILMTFIYGMQLAGFTSEKPFAEAIELGEISLPGNLTVNGKETDVNALEVFKSDGIYVEGILEVKSIKKLMSDTLSGGNVDPNRKLKDLSSTFTATLKAEDGILLDAESSTLTPNDLFVVKEKKQISANEIAIVMELKTKHETVGALKDAVNAVPDILSVNSAARFADTAVSGKVYKFEGTVTGDFHCGLENSNTDLSFKWKAEKNGKSPVIGQVVFNQLPAYKLPGDMKIGEDTEHDKVYELKEKTFTLTGELNVKAIKDLIKDIAVGSKVVVNDQLTALAKQIVIVAASNFTATIELPEGLSAEDVKKADIELVGADGLFEIANTNISADKVEVLMILDSASINNFEDLYNKVQAVDDTLKVNIKGIKITDKAEVGKNYTIKGNLRGEFNGEASLAGNKKLFSFTWLGVQTDDGRDFVNTNPATGDDITFTLTPVKSDNPVAPETEPVKPEVKKNDKTPNTGDSSNAMGYMALVILSAATITTLAVRRKSSVK